MKRILFYCQYLAGMGHLVRSSEIIRSLVPDFQVCWVIGGEPIAGFTLPDGATVVYLPALKEVAGQLIAEQSLEAVQAQRRDKLLATFDQFQPDCIITECFPFSKYKMAFELLPLLERAKAAQVKVVCSLRDLIMTQAMSAKGQIRKQARIHDQIRQYYDLVLYHSDRHFQPLEDCFPTALNLSCEVFYTGYVAQSEPAEPLISPEEQALLDKADPIIVASAGGGRDGYPLLKAIVAVCPCLAQAIPHRIHVFVGPFLPAPQFNELQILAASQPNLTLRRFTPHLLAYLSRAELSVSLGGYNTTMNVLRAGVRSLILPSPSVDQFDEQRRRAARLAAMGVIGLLDPADLDPVRLAQRMLAQLDQPKPIHAINLNGAQNTARRLQALLYGAAASDRSAAIALA